MLVKYLVFKANMFATAIAEGYSLNISENGLWAIADNGTNAISSYCVSEVPSFAPQEIKEAMQEKGWLTLSEALELSGLAEWATVESLEL